MAIGEGYVTALGTVVVAALAIGAAIGGHALVGDTTVEASATPTGSTPVAMSDDFCTVMGDMNTYYAAKSAESGLLSGTINLAAGEDPAVLDEIHQQADPLLEVTAGVGAYLTHGAEVVSDATVADALHVMSAYVKTQGATLAQISREATSVGGFFTAAMGASLDPSAQQSASDADAATAAITDYVTTECAIDVSAALWMDSSGDSSDGSSSSTNTVESDASMLGEAISSVFVDWKEGDSLPEVSLADGTYGVAVTTTTSINSSSFGAASSDPAIVDKSIAGPLDWCVAVTDNAAAAPVTYRYSATGGLEEGTCAALAAGS